MDKDLTYRQAVEKYPDVPKFTILKIDLYRRGLVYTDALKEKYGQYPGPTVLRDGTSVLTAAGECMNDHYTVDLFEDRLGIFYNGEFIEEADFCAKPSYVGKKTSQGTPMESVGMFRPQVINIWAYRYCHFWEGGNACKFCSINTFLKKRLSEREIALDPQDIKEIVAEAISEPGRFSTINITGGADPEGEEPFDSELNRYIKILQAVGENFSSRRFPSQLLACAYNKKQVKRLYDETGVLTYCADMEVWDRERFKWVCPAKEKYVGWDNWVRNLFDAVEIFGPGNVATNIVAGCEMVKPYGFETVDEALKSNLEGCEYLAKHGVSMMGLVFRPVKNSVFHKANQPTLEYYIRLARGMHDIRAAYGLSDNFDDYKHCGNHPDSDLSRVDF
ncbi:MAG: radical SAM protein [Candidatus Schekmanbacteria bacterium]|nr:radical SAM protein [Candidatus Schekmanbacteria bacterium]